MTMIQKTFHVELTEKEVETLVKALFNESKRLRKELKDESKPTQYETREELTAVLPIRNEFGKLINHFFMGEDA